MAKESQININDERQIRLKKMSDLQSLGIQVYPAKTNKKHSINDCLKAKMGSRLSTAGRIMLFRQMGKICFVTLKDESGLMQMVFKQDDIGRDSYKLLTKKIDIADFIEVRGEKMKTKKGELSILVKRWKLLSKAVLPLPDKYHGIQDEELRYRKRYLDLLLNKEVRDIFYRKAKFWQATREFMVKNGFFEVETPALETTSGGASATPFVTHHDALDMDLYLRISMGELWQKRLMVAGFEKTFEIGRQFRNEGMSREHLQDYAQMEFYWAYADYKMGMKLVEKLYKHVAKSVYGTLKFNIGEFKNIDLSKPWKEIDYVREIKKRTGVNILEASEANLRARLRELKVEFKKGDSKGSLIDSLWKYCRKKIKGPAFLVNHPVEVSPLAKRKENNNNLTERFQVIIAGSENGNGYSELNDPVDQAERFQEQAKLREQGDVEAQMHDKDFVTALEHGMPPTCGFGFSERLFSFFEDKSARECVMFPLIKPENE